MSEQQTITQTSIRQAKPSENADKSARIKALYPYTSFDLSKARHRIFKRFNIKARGYSQPIIELLMERVNGQFRKYPNMKPQIGYGETVPITDDKVAELVGCKKSTVKTVRLLYQKAGLWKVERAKGKYGNSRNGVWIYAFTGYLTLDEGQPKVMVKEIEADILEVDFGSADSTVCTNTKSESGLTQMLVQTNIPEVSGQPSNVDSDSVSEVSESSANKVSYKSILKSSSIEGTNGEEEDIIKAEKPVEDTRNEQTQIVPSIVEETLVKVSKIRMNERGRNPVGEAEKPDFRKWLDMYAHKRSKDLDITYEEALIVLPIAWDLANRASRYYRPDTPCYFANGRSNKYAMSYLHDALALWVQGEEFEPEEQEAETVDIETILEQDYGDDPVDSEEQELQMYIHSNRNLLKAREGNNGSALVWLMARPKAQKLGEETAMRLLKLKGIVS